MKNIAIAAAVLVGLTVGPSILERVQTLETKAREAETRDRLLESKIATLSSRIDQLEIARPRIEARADAPSQESRLLRIERDLSTLERKIEGADLLTNHGQLCGAEIGNLLRDRVVRILRHQVRRPMSFRYSDVDVVWHDLGSGRGNWVVAGLGVPEGGRSTVPFVVQFSTMATLGNDERALLATIEPERILIDKETLLEPMR